MTELLFIVQEDEQGLHARAADYSIFAEADTLVHLRDEVRDAINCHFEDPAARPAFAWLHFVKEEVIPLGQ
ncbi:MAG: 2-oxoisovalerate dehydrogenase [Planctomycetaceae bacterium]|nr:hypothetical protein [Planctomycetaceae bacterium]